MTVYSSKMSDPAVTRTYLDTLLQYYEEEVSGEAYFYGLAEHFPEVEKTVLLAKAERVAAQSIEPLLAKYGLEPRARSLLYQEGRDSVQHHQALSWKEFMVHTG